MKNSYIAVPEDNLVTLTDKEYRKLMCDRMKTRRRKIMLRKVRRWYHRNYWWIENVELILYVICMSGGFWAFATLVILIFG